MNQWTQAARRMLDECLNRNRWRFAAEGAEADEVAADLRRHLEFEAVQEQLKVVTEDDVRRILARVDPGLVAPSEPQPPASGELLKPPPRPVQEKPTGEGLGTSLLWLFGVVLPLGTLLAEYFLNLCASELFDPIPTPLHVVLIALVPLANMAALLCLRRNHEVPPAWLWWLHAGALGVAAMYTVWFLPLTPFAALGAIFGLGFLPLSPLLSWICTLVLGARLRRQARQGAARLPQRLWLGWAVTGLVVVGSWIPAALTRHWLEVAATGTEAEQTQAVKWIRRLGSEEQVLLTAYGKARLGLFELQPTWPCTPAQAQEVYFRVAGRPFNAVPPPLSRLRGAGRAVFNEFEWDDALGGETVAGRVSRLSLQSSRLDALAHTADGWGYTEWTLEFRNDHPRLPREARAVLQLPPGGVVSRVTLWVNGEEREAAFAGRGAARAAYQEVAVVQRRDPILVTTVGPDRVLMQCFPIPTNGGIMKIRLGITAPLEPLTEDTRAFVWPRIAERNFAVRDDTRHHAWLELLSGRTDPLPGWFQDANRAHTLHASVSEKEGPERLRGVRLQTEGASGGTWAMDDRGAKPAWVRQRLETSTPKSPGRLAIVLDGGRNAEQWFHPFRRALGRSAGEGELAVWMAHDGVQPVFSGGPSPLAAAAKALERWKVPFEGGHDPGRALEAALDWAGSAPGGTVLWVHGPQPVVSPEMAALRQRLERNGEKVWLIDVSALEGPNRLAEGLDGVPRFTSLARVETLEGDLGRFLDRWSGLVPSFRWVTERTETDPGVEVTASRHLVRLWAAEAVEKLRSERRPTDAVALAARWQLVTPVSGAVVLETQEQFARHGLSPVDPLTTPMVVPEPETWALLAVGTAALAWMMRRKRRSTKVPGLAEPR